MSRVELHGQSPWHLFLRPSLDSARDSSARIPRPLAEGWGGILSEPTAGGRGASRRVDCGHARRIRRWGLGVGLLGLALFGPGLYELARLSLLQRRLDRELARLSAEHERLLRERTRLESDPAYVEGLIRTTFKYARPDELVIPLDQDRANNAKTR